MALNFEYYTQLKPGAKFEKRTVAAPSQAAAEKKLMDLQVPCLSIRRAGKKPRRTRKMGMRDLEQFAQQIQTSQEVQMNIVVALELTKEMASKKWIAEMIEGMRLSVSNGSTLHEAMKKSGAFDELTLGLVSAGERAGFLEKSFEQIKELTRRNLAVKNKVIGLMIYPAIVTIIAIGAIFVLMWKTVPVFAGMYKSAHMELPLPTKLMIAGSDLILHNTLLALAIVGTIVFFIFKIPAIYNYFPFLHPICLRLPGIGTVQKKLMQATFTRTLADMLNAQTRIVDALVLCRDVSTNYVYKGHVARAIIAIAKGTKIGKAFAPSVDVFGPLMIKAMVFGDSVGKVEDILSPMSSSLDRELSEYIDQMKTVMEPILTVFIGGIVLFVMLALFIPVFNMGSLVK